MKFNEEFTKVVDALAEKMGVVVDWTNEKVLPYILDLFERWQHYEILVTLFWIFFVLALIVFSFYIISKLIKNKNELGLNKYELLYKVFYKLSDGKYHDWKPCYESDAKTMVGYSAYSIAVFILLALLIVILGIVEINMIASLIKIITVPELVLYETFM